MDKKRLLELNANMSPVRVEFELTEQCNLSCIFCYNSRRPAVSKNVYAVLDKLYTENVLEIVLTGGEPMLHPDFSNTLIKCRSMFSNVMVQTNGTYITSETAEFFKKYELSGINVSLHGNKYIHEQLTGTAKSYGAAVSGIACLLEKGIRVASNFVLTAKNISILPETMNMLYTMGIKEMTLTRFTPTGAGAGNADLSVSRDQLINALYSAKQKMDIYTDFKIILANSIPYCALPEDLDFFCSYCHFGSSRFYIDIHGNVLMCGMSRIVIGNILDNTFKEIKERSYEYQAHITGTDAPQVCIRCNNFNRCRGGCRAAAYAYTKDICGKDPLCMEV
jgi:radical SAM protein with 4Fe4S-binding SPASM domain